MAITLNDAQFHLSGGAANADPQLAFGGAISTHANTRIISQTTETVTNVTGVIFDHSVGNQEGQGLLTWVAGSSSLLWRSAGTSTSTGIVITGDGQYILGNSAGYQVVTVTQASLPGADAQDFLTVTNSANNVWDDVTELESLSGLVEYRCHYVTNTSGVDTAFGIRLWIDTPPSGGSLTLGIALDLAGLNGTAATIVDETDSTNQVSGLSFTSPTDYNSGLVIGDLAPGDSYAFWMRRTVPVGNRALTAPEDAALVMSVFTA